MLDRFSSTPLQEEEYSTLDTLELRHKLTAGAALDAAALTSSERQYLNHILQNGDTDSIQSASAKLQDETLFPHQQHLEPSSSSSDEETSANNRHPAQQPPHQRAPRRNSLLQQKLFQLHESEQVHPSEVLQRMTYTAQRKNSILAMEDTSSNNNRHSPRSLSPPVVVPARVDQEMRQPPPPTAIRTVSGGLSTAIARVEHVLVPGSGSHWQGRPLLVSSSASQLDESDHHHPEFSHSNSIMETDHGASSTILEEGGDDVEGGAFRITEHYPQQQQQQQQSPPDGLPQVDSWDPFEDVSSWLDGSQGVEVTTTGIPTLVRQSSTTTEPALRPKAATTTTSAAPPFRILGLSSDDVSCHPHVLSPPLMESLLAFVPDYATGGVGGVDDNGLDTTTTASLSDPATAVVTCAAQQLHCPQDTTITTSRIPSPPPASSSGGFNFWLKYSLVRDGPGLWTFLRQVRASTHCILAIETEDGHVLGAYTSQPWRLAKGWYGSKEEDTFLWKMRRSRLEISGQSIVEQVAHESEIQVFPYRTGNAAVQYCSNKCLMLGQGEIIPPSNKNSKNSNNSIDPGGNQHYGYALYLDKDLQHGTTSTSETFGNPCLTDPQARGARFRVSNLECWTLTPHDTVAAAEQSELSNLFLDGGRDGGRRLNFMNILLPAPM